MLRAKAFYLTGAILIFCFSILQSESIGVVAETNSWVNSNPALVVGRDATSNDIRTPRTCSPATWQYYSYTDKDNRPSKNPRLLSVEACGLGGIGSGYVEAGYAYKIKGSVSVLGIPNNSKVIMAYGVQSGLALSIEDSLSPAGTFTAASPNGPLEGTYEVTAPLKVFKNDQNQTIPFNYNSYNFSPNGKYIVAEIPYVGLVRINTDTEELLLFSTQTYNYGQGYDPTPQLGISNDGRTAVVSNFEGGPLNLYDLSDCTAKQIKAYDNVATGCKSPRDIKTLVKTQFPNYWRLSGIRFAENDQSIYGILTDYNPTTKVRINKKVTFNTAGYVPEPTNYIAMGDSFASGEGDMNGETWYEQGTDSDTNKCHLSKRSYPYLLSQFLDNSEFHSVACSGANINHVISEIQYDRIQTNTQLGEWAPGKDKQINYLGKIKPRYITLSIGGNDVGFSQKLSACVTNDYYVPVPDTCKYADNLVVRASVAKEIADKYEVLKATYETLKDKTNGDTKIFVMGYPQFVRGEGGNCGNNVHLNDQEREFVHNSVKYMNQVIKASATDAGVHYLDIEDTLLGRNLCSGAPDSQMAVNGVTEGDDKLSFSYVALNEQNKLYVNDTPGLANESFHPNQNAQPLIRDRILELTNNDPARFTTCPSQPDHAVCDSKKGKIPEPTTSYFGVEATSYIKSKNAESTQVFPLFRQQKQMIPEDTQQQYTKVILDGLKPGSAVKLEGQSSPVDLGTFYADSSGILDITIDLEGKLPPGSHEIHAYTKNVAGESQEYYQHVFITGPTGDVNGNNIPDDQDQCGFVADSNVDKDKDSINDACDAIISDPLPEVIEPAINESSSQLSIKDVLVEERGDDFLQFGLNTSSVASSISLSFSTIANNTITAINGDENRSLTLFGQNNLQASSDFSQNFKNAENRLSTSQKIGQPTKTTNWFLVILVTLVVVLAGISIIIKVLK